ncbi:MAG: ABC transporter ATP-binding protein [Gammaproteobacteria bacterium]|nr:ABC transporter ATP-binding protein [Gammaproteobacteria bacterium]
MTELTLQALTIRRGTRVLSHELTQTLQGGECWGVLGANGAGKTTLLHTLAGLYPDDSGTILLNGSTVEGYSRRQMAQRLGLLFQSHESSFPATVLETVLQGRHPHIPSWKWEDADDLKKSLSALRQVGLDAMQNRSATKLSGGEQQRLAIATLLNQAPEIYLLDEPSNHLDLHQQIKILDLFAAQVKEQNKLCVMALHDVNLVQRYCDHVILMLGEGNSISGKTSEVLTAENLTRLYGHPMLVVEGPHGPLFVPR